MLIGSLPILMRISMYLIVDDLTFDYVLNDTDIVAFGLVLCIGNLKELESQTEIGAKVKESIKGCQFILIIVMSAFLWTSYYTDIDETSKLNKIKISRCTQVLTTICFLSSIVIYYNPKYKNGEA